MSSHTTGNINGYTFGFLHIGILPGGDGVVVPGDIDPDEPGFIDALKIALEAQKAYFAICWVEDFYDNQNPNYSSGYTEDDILEALEKIELVLNHSYWVWEDHSRSQNRVQIEFTSLRYNLLGILREQEAKREKEELKKNKKNKKSRKTPKAGYVYLLQSPSEYYKIGFSATPEDRVKTFKNKLPFEVEYICLIPTDNMKKLEGELHDRFEDRRVDGEWFALTENDVAYIKLLAEDAKGQL